MPHAIEFPVLSLRAGRKAWFAGAGGPQLEMVDSIFNIKAAKFQKETTIQGRATSESLVFEVHKIDYSPANIRRLVQKEKDWRDGLLSPSDSSGSSPGSESNDESEKPQNETIEMADAFKAFDLAPRKAFEIRFKDVVSIDASGDSMTLTLNHAPRCSAKASGKPRAASLEAVSDFTGAAQTITFRSSRSIDLRHCLTKQCPQLESLISCESPSATSSLIMDVATPNRKRERPRSMTPLQDSTNLQEISPKSRSPLSPATPTQLRRDVATPTQCRHVVTPTQIRREVLTPRQIRRDAVTPTHPSEGPAKRPRRGGSSVTRDKLQRTDPRQRTLSWQIPMPR